MGLINVVVKHDGTDITNSTISYNREQDICTGIGTLELIVPLNINRTFKPWDVIEIWENGNKKAKFFLDYTSEDAAAGVIRMKATDGYKKIADYFITDSYTVDYLSYGRYWIEKFLTEAGVSYTFTVADNGSPLSNNTSMGFDSAANVITNLLQQSGWYIYFDEDGDAIVGDLNKDVNSPDHSIDSSDIQTIARELDDERLRNRAVVWGNANPTYGEVFVDISVPTPWNYDAQDKRAVVLSNSAIFSNDQALELAQMMLKEFTKIKDEKTLLVVNDYNLKIGEILKVTTKYWAGRGLITGLVANMDQNGLVYEVTLNKKCPRLFTYFGNYPDTVDGFYVYIGTAGDGIWRKYVNSSTWSNDSSGLEDLNIKDLAISNGNFAAVADDGYLYTRSSELSAWNKYTPPNLRDVSGVTYSNMDLRAVACSVNISDNIIAGYNYVPSGIMASGVLPSGMSWVLELTGAQTLIRAEQVTISGGWGEYENKYSIYDLESTGEYNIVSVSGFAPVSGYVTNAVGEYLTNGAGRRELTMWRYGGNDYQLPPDSGCLNLGFGYGYIGPSEISYVNVGNLTYKSSLINDNVDNEVFWYWGTNSTKTTGYVVKIDMSALSYTVWSFTGPAEWVDVVNTSWHLRQKTSTTFDLVVLLRDDGHPYEYRTYEYNYTLGDSSITYSSMYDLGGVSVEGAGIAGNQFMIGYWGSSINALVLNLDSGTFTDNVVWNGDGAGYQGASGSVDFSSTGDGLVYQLVWLAGTNLEDFYFFGWHTEPTAVELRAAAWQITKYGGSQIIGPTTLIKWENDMHPLADYYTSFINSTSGTYAGLTTPAVNTNLKKSYTMVAITNNVIANGGAYGSRHYRGFTVGISYPDLSMFYYEASDSGSWWSAAEGYTPAQGGTELVGKTAGDTSCNTANLPSHAYHGKYTSPCWMIWDWDTYPTGQGFKLFRNAPAWGTSFGYDTFDDFADCANFGYVGYYRTSDDITGQLAGAPNTGSTSLPIFPRWNNECPTPTLVWRPYVGDGGLTQIYGVNRGYTVIKQTTNHLANYPRGTVLKHTSTTELGDKITATDDSLEQTIGIFEVIKTTEKPVKVDIAKGSPTVIYDIPPDDGSNTIDFWATIQNEEDTFYTHADPKPVFEARVFDLPKPGTFPTVSGEFNPKDYERYIGISNREGILASEYYLDTPWVNMVTVASGVAVSGLITHFETTNYVSEGTYFFYTVSGVKSFYQKDPEASYWQDFSIGLPDSEITIIRVDDYI